MDYEMNDYFFEYDEYEDLPATESFVEFGMEIAEEGFGEFGERILAMVQRLIETVKRLILKIKQKFDKRKTLYIPYKASEALKGIIALSNDVYHNYFAKPVSIPKETQEIIDAKLNKFLKDTTWDSFKYEYTSKDKKDINNLGNGSLIYVSEIYNALIKTSKSLTHIYKQIKIAQKNQENMDKYNLMMKVEKGVITICNRILSNGLDVDKFKDKSDENK